MIILAVAAVILIVVVVFLVMGRADEAPVSVPVSEGTLETNTVVFTDSGFSPAALTVRVGDTVVFENRSSMDFWPASAMHPRLIETECAKSVVPVTPSSMHAAIVGSFGAKVYCTATRSLLHGASSGASIAVTVACP